MKKLLAMAAILCLSACSPPPPPPKPVYPMCDYCKKPQKDAKIYPCRKCGGSHSSCSVEAPLHVIDARKDKEGFAMGRSVKICPASEDK